MTRMIYVSLLIALFLFSCDNVSSSKEDSQRSNLVKSSKLKEFAYKIKGGTALTTSTFNDTSEMSYDPSKALHLYTGFGVHRSSIDSSKTEQYQMAFGELMYFEPDSMFGSFLAFSDVKLGNLEFKSMFDMDTTWNDTTWNDTTDSSGTINVSGLIRCDDYNVYSWSLEDGQAIPAELKGGATPPFSASFNGNTFGKTLSPLPSAENVLNELTTETVVDLNNDLTINFGSTLPAGTFVGFQVLPLCSGDSVYIQGGEIYNLYLEYELTEPANSVTFTADDFKEIRDGINEPSKVIADVFVFLHTKIDDVSIDGTRKLSVVMSSSNSVSVRLKK